MEAKSIDKNHKDVKDLFKQVLPPIANAPWPSFLT